MASLNRVFLMGNLTRDPELRYTPGGSAVCEFGIAINRRFTQGGGDVKEEVTFVDIVVWAKQAETAQRYLQKGSAVFIEGRLVYDAWTEKDTNKKRSRLRVVAERVQFVGRRDDANGSAPGEYSQEQQPQGGHAAPPQRPQRPYQGGGAPQGGQQAPRQGYQQAPRTSAPPPMPKDEPFEVVEGVDDDIPF